MKICVTSTSDSLDAFADPRFGRCRFFVIVDSRTMEFEAVPNNALDSMSGAGVQAAQIVAGKGAAVLITGDVGPNAFRALSDAGIKVVAGSFGKVMEVVEKYRRGELTETLAPTVQGHFRGGGGRRRGGRRL